MPAPAASRLPSGELTKVKQATSNKQAGKQTSKQASKQGASTQASNQARASTSILVHSGQGSTCKESTIVGAPHRAIGTGGFDDLLEIIWHRGPSEQGLYSGWSSFDKQQGCAVRGAVLSSGYGARPHQGRLKVKTLQHLKLPESSWFSRIGNVSEGQGYGVTPLRACNASSTHIHMSLSVATNAGAQSIHPA